MMFAHGANDVALNSAMMFALRANDVCALAQMMFRPWQNVAHGANWGMESEAIYGARRSKVVPKAQ